MNQYRKIRQDKKSATLLHPDGHEIRIALAGLNPKLRKELESIPLYQAEGSEEPVEALDESSPEPAIDTPEQAPVAQPVPEQAPPQPVAVPTVAQPAQASAAPVEPQDTSTSLPPQAPPVAEPMAAPKPAPVPKTPEQEAAAKTAENFKFGQDIMAGHIKKKTYGDLYAEKSTLGKIGTIFGLILSGAGSGLAHQQNAALAAMDREIDRDLEVQKRNQEKDLEAGKFNRDKNIEEQKLIQDSGQNWYSLSLKKYQADADVAKTRADTRMSGAQASEQEFYNKEAGAKDNVQVNSSPDLSMNDASKSAQGKIKELMALTDSKNNMRMGAFGSLQDSVNKMPPGPSRDQAQQNLNNMIQPMAKAVHDDNARAEIEKQKILDQHAASTASQAANKKQKTSDQQAASAGPKSEVEKDKMLGDGPINTDHYQEMIRKGKILGRKGYVDTKKGIDPADNSSLEKAITESQVNWKNYKDVMEVTNALAQKKNAGQTGLGKIANAVSEIPWIGTATAAALNFAQGDAERERNILVDALSQRLAGSGASDRTIHEMKDALTVNMFDNPATLKKLQETVYQHFAHNDKEQNSMFTKYPGIKKEMPKLEIKAGESMKKEAKTKSALDQLLKSTAKGYSFSKYLDD